MVFDPQGRQLRRAAEGVLGVARSDAGHAPGQRRRHAVPLGDLHARRRAARGGERVARRVRARADARPATAPITTEIADAPAFFYAEDYHQQYLAKNPDGYCGIGGTGVSCPVGAARQRPALSLRAAPQTSGLRYAEQSDCQEGQARAAGGKEPDDRGGRVRPRGDRARAQGQARRPLEKQAIAIGLSKARRAGVPLKPPAPGTHERHDAALRRARLETGQGRRKPRAPSSQRSRSNKRRLKREGRRPASRSGASRQRSRRAARSARSRRLSEADLEAAGVVAAAADAGGFADRHGPPEDRRDGARDEPAFEVAHRLSRLWAPAQATHSRTTTRHPIRSRRRPRRPRA